MARAQYKVLSAKQVQAVSRALGRRGQRLPTMGGCILTQRSGKVKSFGVLPPGTTMEVCRMIHSGKDVITARVLNAPRRKSALAGARKRRRSR